MHEFRRGEEGWGKVVDLRWSLGMIRGVTAAASIERDIARRRGNGRRKEIRKWPVKVLELRGHVALQRNVSELTRADFLHFHLVVLRLPSPVPSPLPTRAIPRINLPPDDLCTFPLSPDLWVRPVEVSGFNRKNGLERRPFWIERTRLRKSRLFQSLWFSRSSLFYTILFYNIVP